MLSQRTWEMSPDGHTGAVAENDAALEPLAENDAALEPQQRVLPRQV